MKYTATLILLVTFSFFSDEVIGQQFEISGTIKEADGKGIAAVNVSLLNSSDSSWLQTEITDDEGGYKLSNISTGKYLMAINALGYKDTVMPIIVVSNVHDQNYVLQKGNTQLGAVVVRGRRDMLRTELGQTIIDIGNSAKEGKNVLEVLQQLPGVRVSPSGVISVQGKQGLVVLINDKPTYLQGEELANYLRGISAADVNNVALMTQPSAKYDADGNVGIISINMKKVKKDGVSGNAMIRHSQGIYGLTSANSTVNYKKGNVTLYATPSTYFGSNFLLRDRVITSKDPVTGEVNTTLKTSAFLKETYDDYNLKLGADIVLSDKTRIGANVKGIYHTNTELDRTKAIITDYVVTDERVNITLNNNGHARELWYATGYLDHDITDKHKLSSQLDFFRTNRNNYQHISSVDYDKYGNQLPNKVLLDNKTPTVNDLYSAKLDYTGNVGNCDLEGGVKGSYVWIDDKNIFYTSNKGSLNYDSSKSNHFVYNENINAAYISVATKKGKWQAKSGLRAELSFISGIEYVQQKSFNRKRLSLFPTLYVSYSVDSNNTLECNYGRRIKRPYYRELNPFIGYESQYSYTKGNPNLMPQYANNFELKHNYKSRLITSLGYTYSYNLFADLLEYNEQTKVSNYSTTNRGTGQSIDLSMYLNIPVIQGWLLTSTCRGWYVANYTEDELSKGWGYNVSLDSQFTFKRGWYADFNVGYSSNIIQSTTGNVAPSVWSSANVSKKVFNDSGTFKFSVNDPFNAYRYKPTVTNGNTTSVSTNTFSSSAAILSFSYNFGNNNDKKRNAVSTDELNRM